MIDKIYSNPDIYHIDIPLKKNALKNLNCYVIKTGKESLVIDTGFNTEECKQALLQGLDELSVDYTKTRLFITHLHTDHLGLAEEFEKRGCEIFMGETEYHYFSYIQSGDYWDEIDRLFLKEGFPLEELNLQKKDNPARVYGIKHVFPAVCVKDGDYINIGDSVLECIETPGHTPGHMCLYLRKENIMFSGDHILYNITPNIMFRPNTGNPLEQYLKSLEKIDRYDVKLTLPAHRWGVGKDIHQRIKEIKKHHELRLQEVTAIVNNNRPQNAYETAGYMKWSLHGADWGNAPKQQKWFAVGEAIAHLRYLENRKYLE